MGRKKKNYRSKIRSVNIGDMMAWEICKKKKINLSEEITRYVQFLAYSHRVQDNKEGLERTKLMLLRQMQALEVVQEKEMTEIGKKYEGMIKATAIKVNKISVLQRTKELERIQTAKAIARIK